MAYWVVKARKSQTDLAELVRPGRTAMWETKRPPKGWKPGDGVFLWQGSPVSRLMGLGTITDIPDAKRGGAAQFEVAYGEPLEDGPSLAQLREVAHLANASFLKAGAAGTVFPLSAREAAALRKKARRGSETLDEWHAAVEAADEPEMAISIRQPYVEMILRGLKTSEFRSRPTKRRGRVFLYAGLKPAPERAWTQAACEPGSLPTGLVVGTVDVMTCVEDATHGYAYRLANPVRFERGRKPKGHPQPVWFRPF